jgi:hypothetical protein
MASRDLGNNMKYLFYHDWKKNYGDILSPYILDALGVSYTVTDYTHCNMIMIGSIATQARAGMNVYGSGFMWRTDPVCKDANWHWVRGPISRQKILDAGGTCSPVYGDPAMILPHIWEPAKKVHDIGIVPHYVDFHYCKQHYREYTVDLITTDPVRTTSEITACRSIISSSLHGLIVAHAYGIPAAWVKFTDQLDGDDMKFHDHFLSLGVEPVLSTYENPVFTQGSINCTPLIGILKG